MSAHTPGPWLQLSHKYLSIDRGETPQVFRQATEADERLMKAAPDLLAALKAAITIMGERNIDTLASAEAILLDAIAKADGQP